MTSSKPALQNIQNYFKRVGRSLAGKPDLNLPEVQVRPPEMIVADLCEIPQSDWWAYAFSREPMNGRFQDDERKSLYEEAFRCGTQEAEKILAEYGELSAEELARKLGMDVQYPEMPQSRARILFAEFAEPKTIRVYKDGLRKGNLLLNRLEIRKHLGDDIRIEDILIGHELFHVLELRNPQIYTKSHRISLWKIGKLENLSPVAVLSEIAAMAFSARLNNLEYSPFVMDAFLVYGYSPQAASALYEEMMKAAGRKVSYAKVGVIAA